MRFSTIIISGVLAALSVSAQNTTSAVVSGTQPVTPAQSSQAACLSACSATDPKCRDACIVNPTGVPNPAIACINACVQGNGTAAENLAYENCQRNCRASASLVTSTSAPTGTATGTAATATGSGATASNGSNGSSSGAVRASGTSTGAASAATGSSTGSGTATPSKSSAANSDNVRAGMTVAGVFGAFAAVLAL